MAKYGSGHLATQPLTAEDVAWAAGIFEGEGCARADKRWKNGTHVTRVYVTQKGDWILEKLVSLYGGTINHPKQQPWMGFWQVSGRNARIFLMTIMKYLSPRRRAQVLVAMSGETS